MGAVLCSRGGPDLRRGMISAPPFMPPGGMGFPGGLPSMPPMPASIPPMPQMPPQPPPAPPQQGQPPHQPVQYPAQGQPADPQPFPNQQAQEAQASAPPEPVQPWQGNVDPAAYQQWLGQQAYAQQMMNSQGWQPPALQQAFQQQQQAVLAALLPHLLPQLQALQASGQNPQAQAQFEQPTVQPQPAGPGAPQNPQPAPVAMRPGTYSTKGAGIQYTTRR